MTIRQPDGSRGLLADGQFGDAVKAELRGLGLEHKVQQVIDSGNQQVHSLPCSLRPACVGS